MFPLNDTKGVEMASQAINPELYELHQVEREELHEEWVWIRNENLRKRIEDRRPAVLFKFAGNSSVCCETLYADDTYLSKRHNPIDPISVRGNNLIFMNAWYRRHLGIEAKDVGLKIPLIVKPPSSRLQGMWWQVRACARHPQIAVVMSTVLAFLGTGLGVAGLAAVLKDLPWLKDVSYIQWVSLGGVLLGIAIFLTGFVPLFMRARIPTDN